MPTKPQKQVTRRTASARAEKCDLYARLFELESDAVLLVDNATGRVLEVNPAACALYGYSRDEWLGMVNTAVSTEPEKTREVARQHLTHVPLRLHRKKDGTIFPVETLCSHFTWQGRDVHLAALRDISERMRTESALRETAEAFRTLADNAPDVVARIDSDLRHLYVSPAIKAFTGRPASEFIGKTNAELGFPADLDAVWSRAFRSVFETRQTTTVEFTVPTPHGPRWFHSRIAPEFAADGSVACVLAISRDLTLRKQAEDALARSERKYRHLYKSVHDGFVSTDMAGRIVEFNQPYLDMLGYTDNEIVTLTYKQITPPRWHAMESEIVRQVMARGHSELYQKEYIRKDGTVFPVELRTHLIRDTDDQPSGMWAFVRDITERKRVETALQQAKDELEQQVRARTARLRELTLELTRTEQRERRRIAHILHEDLQQLLAAAKFRLGELQQDAPTPPLRQAADAALGALDRAIQISRSLTVELRPPVLYELGLHAALDWLAQDIHQKFGLTVHCDVAHAPEPASDDMRIFAFETVRELLLNVAKHAGVKSAVVRAAVAGPDQVSITVQDAGKGFTPAAGVSATFGLFSIRERADAFGGDLTIDSAPGRGSRITLTLPVR